MIRPTAAAVVYLLCVSPADLRKQAASLALLVEQSLKRDVFAPVLYVFNNARRDFVLGAQRPGWGDKLERLRHT